MWQALAARLLPMVLEGGGAAAEGSAASRVASTASKVSSLSQAQQSGGSQKTSAAPAAGPTQGAGSSPMYTGTY